MDTPRPCGCKGCRTCLICEKDFGISKNINVTKENGTYVYCPWCNKAWSGWDTNDYLTHPNHIGDSIEYPGVYIQLDFLSDEEEQYLMSGIDEMPWDLSQSGRRKQNFGPKCNFKKQRLRLGEFTGFPKFSKFVQEKMRDVGILKDFQTIEQCSLEYDPKRGASIDPHIDDCWIWGERIVTVNLQADSVLTMTKFIGDDKKYNLKCVSEYPAVLDHSGKFNVTNEDFKISNSSEKENKFPVIRIPMPRKSLLVMYGAARYDWEHQILREDIVDRRVCLAYREFTPPYLPGGNEHPKSVDILDNAAIFF